MAESPLRARRSHDVPDGRTLRRDRNRDRVLDAVLELWGEELVMPTIDAIVERSGVSLRSLYRYFGDTDELIAVAIAHDRDVMAPLGRIHEFAKGPLAVRIDRLVKSRVTIYRQNRAVYRAAVYHAVRVEQIREHLESNKDAFRLQTEQQFAMELDALPTPQRRATGLGCDLVTQLDSIEYCLSGRGLSWKQTATHIRGTLAVLLD